MRQGFPRGNRMLIFLGAFASIACGPATTAVMPGLDPGIHVFW
jgi:hypothetical protein